MAEVSEDGQRGLDEGFRAGFRHRVVFTRGVSELDNPVLDDLLSGGAEGTRGERSQARGLLVIDSGLNAAQSGFAERLVLRLRRAGVRMDAPPLVVPGGERAKNGLQVAEQVIAAIDAAHICRRSYVFVAGGGAVLDAVGFAASTAHRGVRLVRFPSTTLAQDDAGIGVKNGVNMLGKKNLVGVFDVPFAVVNDLSLLSSLGPRDWRAGFSEAVKVAALKDPQFFSLIERSAPMIAARHMSAAEGVIRRSAELHYEHIVRGGDPFERERARPLDFGHWAAHRLETMTGHRLLHGEAVAVGMALDCRYAVRKGLLGEGVAERVLRTLEALGFTLRDEALRQVDALLIGAEEFREHLGGRMAITMLRGLGDPVEIDAIDHDVVRAAACDLLARAEPSQGEVRAG